MSDDYKFHPSFSTKEKDKILPYDLFEASNYEQQVMEKMDLKNSDFDLQTKLWDHTNQKDIRMLYDEKECNKENRELGRYISTDVVLEFQNQIGNTCISTCLAILVNGLSKGKIAPEIRDVRRKINTQSPRTWSAFLEEKTGYRLAYCNFDRRNIQHYSEELKTINDLFLVSWYSTKGNYGEERDGKIWTGGSHVVIWYRNQIFDTNSTFKEQMNWEEYFNKEEAKKKSVKRIFRVVAPWSEHGL